MTTDIITTRAFFSVLYGCCFTWHIYSRHDGKSPLGDEGGEIHRERYRPYIPGYLLPIFMIALTALSFFLYGAQTSLDLILSFGFSVFLHINLYYMLLMPALPALRRRISARGCAILWMIPNFLYVTQGLSMKIPYPLWVIHVSKRLAWILFFIWGAGFLMVILRSVVSHLVFRFRILRGSSDITDPDILTVWQAEIDRAQINEPKFRPVVSPHVRTPLSVGLFKQSIRVVLPDRAYSPEDLALIFRHEIIHIGRQDSWSKFFLVFCTAMCWFNPLMWIAMRKSADDLELSCDETVLTDSDDDTRHRYASLLLSTAGDERGFTTCLSASASALRYRLKNVMKPSKKRSGALTVGCLFSLLCMTCGYAALSIGGYTGAEVIYRSQEPERYSLTSAMLNCKSGHYTLDCTDEDALERYLSSLHLEHIQGNYSFSDDGGEITLIYDTPGELIAVTLSGHIVKVSAYTEMRSEYYYVPEGLDRETLERCLAVSADSDVPPVE